MNRRERYLESMLRDLGSVYYQTLLGEASEADVARAVENVRAHRADAAGAPPEARQAPPVPPPRRGRWRVSDVMETGVLSVDRETPYKEVARLLAEHDLSAIPVVTGGGRVLGMVSEADVLRKEERSFGRIGLGLPRRTHKERSQAGALTAAGLMTSPPVTIHPDAPLGAAARLMNGHHIRRLPVVSPAGELLGVVSRQDVLRVFLRPDAELADEIADALGEMLLGQTARVTVTVTDGEVTLGGAVPTAEQKDTAVRVASDVDGVVAVASRLEADGPASAAGR